MGLRRREPWLISIPKSSIVYRQSSIASGPEILLHVYVVFRPFVQSYFQDRRSSGPSSAAILDGLLGRTRKTAPPPWFFSQHLSTAIASAPQATLFPAFSPQASHPATSNRRLEV